MFEIRIICDPTDTERVTTALAQAFTTGAVRRSPSRTSDKERLYVTAEHREHTEKWPTPEQAYAKAPNIISEIGWTAQRAREALWPVHQSDVREFWLRKAALLDRIALDDRTAGIHTDAPEVALNAARKLLDVDRDGVGNYGGTPYWPEHPEAIADPRGYVRQEYGLWAKNK
ncbi:hypothetical protein NLX86_20060 [Streptomyces sp. A3M-1-3]|uniref:hypothetical protein n=1 Tax=Streptomyces sp. A3M-1-3 TaxID=2962044 RepID=UPI0020B8F992|nr:hypothetical protein [Streptomyces sp. A3M-1-3]MCP3820309.1 hypothetical protein [Streptomyces sp. A3M-1-3]